MLRSQVLRSGKEVTVLPTAGPDPPSLHRKVTMPKLPFDDEHAPIYSLGQVADMLQVQQAYLRRLDQHDVVTPSRSDGGQRRYSRHDILTVQHVTRMADEGMTLIAIRRILELESEVARLREELSRARAQAREAEPD